MEFFKCCRLAHSSMQIYFLVSHDLFLCFLKMYTSNSYKIYDMSQFVECVREAHKKTSLCVSQRQLVPGLIIHYVYKVDPYYSLQQFFVIFLLVLFVHHIVPLLLVYVVCSKQFLQVLWDYLLSNNTPLQIVFLQSLIPLLTCKGARGGQRI